MIRVRCANCGLEIAIAATHAGGQTKCPKCKGSIRIPGKDQADASTTEAGGLEPDGLRLDPALFDIPAKPASEAYSHEGPAGTLPQPAEKLAERSAMEEIEPAGRPKLPWFIDVFLYPLNVSGIIHLICLWLLVFLLCPLVMALLSLGIEYIPIVYTLPIAYVLYYFTECIRDSAAGRSRAPDFWMHPTDSDKWDCISQLLIVLGCIAVCFCPTSVYYIVTERTDLIYRLLLACGVFFLPMVLLAVVLFDSFNGLNPILIIGSIFRTFVPYCGMVVLFWGGALLCMKIDPRFYRPRLLSAVPFVSRALQLYLMFVAVGLLGRFYWKYREKLNWEV